MVLEFDSSRFLFDGEDGDERIFDGGGDGVIDGRRIDDRIIPEEEPGEIILRPVPTGQYRKSRHLRGIGLPPVAGDSPGTQPAQPAQQLVSGPSIDFSVTETVANGPRYHWTGFFDFDNEEHTFNVSVNGGGFVVRLDGADVIGGRGEILTHALIARTVSFKRFVTAGRHLLSVVWTPPIGAVGRIRFNVSKVPEKTWRSCDDGLTRAGDPPSGWVLTRSGCFKPPLTGEDDTPVIDLLDVVDVRPGPESRVERAYVLGSGTALTPHRLKFFNRSTNMTVNIALGGPKPARFVTAFQFVGDVGIGGLPSDSFELKTLEERAVDVIFDARELDVLPEGLIRSDILVAMSAGTITIAKDQDDNIDVGEPLPVDEPIELPVEEPILPPEEEEIPPPTPTWDDCSTGTRVTKEGFPPDNFILRSDGCYVAPPPPPPVITLNVGFRELEPRFDGSRSIARAQLTANLSGDDPNTFAYSWNFDVNSQGAGTGNTQIRAPIASYRLTDNDLRRLEDSLDGKTTRSVEVIARKGTTTVRSRRTITLDNPELVFILPPVEEPREEEPTRIDGGGGGGGGEPFLDGENGRDGSEFLF